jgi:hypothetical protein
MCMVIERIQIKRSSSSDSMDIEREQQAIMSPVHLFVPRKIGVNSTLVA